MRYLPPLLSALGAIEALLIARLLLRLLAARPDNPAFAALLAVTGVLRAPLAALDAAQPRFGATLEFSTLVLLVLLAAIMLALGLLARRDAQTARISHG